MELILYIIIRGLAIGIFISAPMGPIGVLCIQRTLNKGRMAGFYTGIGAAISDFIYCLLTGLGMSFVTEFIETNKNILQIIGSVVLFIFAIYLIKKKYANRGDTKRKLKDISASRPEHIQNLITGFFFTFSNPLIVFLIIGLFARFNFILPEFQFYHYIIGFIFIVIGALLWWLFITYAVDKLRASITQRTLVWVNKIIGIIILIMAFIGFITGLKAYLLV